VDETRGTNGVSRWSASSRSGKLHGGPGSCHDQVVLGVSALSPGDGQKCVTLLEVAAIPPWVASRFLVLSSNS
jgi:hypothetical protein